MIFAAATAAPLWIQAPSSKALITEATDGRYLRAAGIPTYGVSGVFIDLGDVRAHGRDERLPVKSFYDGQEFMYRLTRALSSQRVVP